MKALLILLAILAISLPAIANQPPQLTAVEAAQIAQSDLETRGLQSEIYIAQIIYKKDGLMGGKRYWEIMWNKSFPAKTKGRDEIGLRIGLDGNYTRAVR